MLTAGPSKIARLVKGVADGIDVEKCKVMHIGGTNRNYRYHMDQKELQVVEEDKDLGMLIPNNLKASQQCTAACNKVNRVWGMMNRTIVYKSKEVLLNLYKSC